MTDNENLAERIKTLRTAKHMGIRELGRAVDVTGMHISNIEKGKVMPSAALVQKLAVALDANVDELQFLADQVDPEVVDVIHNNPMAIPTFLRTAKNLTPEQWAKLQKQAEKMSKEK